MSQVNVAAVSDRVLVGAGSTPCTLQFRFENTYATLLEKVNLSYKIRVTPPPLTVLMEGRRRRATACLRALEEDHKNILQRLGLAETDRTALQEEVITIERQIEEMEATLGSIRTEELQLKKFVGLQEPIKFMSDNLFD